MTIYVLTTAVVTILVGKLSDVYRRKPLMSLEVGLFRVGAFLSEVSGNIFELIA